MNNQSIRKINAGNSDKLQRVLGTFDENINVLMQEFGVIVRVDGLNIVVSGTEDKVVQAASVIENLLVLAESGEGIDKGRTQYCIELAKEGKASDIKSCPPARSP